MPAVISPVVFVALFKNITGVNGPIAMFITQFKHQNFHLVNGEEGIYF